MSRCGRMRWAGGVAVGAIACAGVAVRAIAARGETLESALMQAYQNNPTLNSQRACVRATDESVPQALSGYRPRVTDHRARGGEQSLSTRPSKAAVRRHPPGSGHLFDPERLQRAVRLRRHHHADDLQRLPDRQPHPPGRGAGAGGARDLARDRADRAAQRGDRLHEPAARQRDPRPAAAQRRGAAGAAAADPRPLQCRRGDAHRRGAVGIAAGRRPLAGAHRGIQLQGVGRDLSPGDRHQSGQAHARHAGRPVLAAKPSRGGRLRQRHPSGGDHRAIQCRRGAVAGESRRRRALSDAVGAGQRATRTT